MKSWNTHGMKQEPEAGPHLEPEISRQRRRRLSAGWRSFALLGAGVLIAFAVLFAYNAVQPGQTRITPRDIDDAVARALASATPPPPAARLVYEAIRPSLVEIDSRFAGDDGKSEEGRGTGVVVDEGGAILTSLHVVQDASDITVVFADGTQSKAVILATQPEKDIAVLRALEPPPLLVPAIMGDPRTLQIGDEAIVVGNPFGLTGSLTTGAISGLGRDFVRPDGSRRLTGLIQFDAAVNPGNSGGPLLNRDGEVVGIVTALLNPTSHEVFIGIGFAVPIDVAAGALGSPPY